MSQNKIITHHLFINIINSFTTKDEFEEDGFHIG